MTHNADYVAPYNRWARPYCGVREIIKTTYGQAWTDHFCATKSPGHDGLHQCICGAQFDGSQEGRTDG